MSKILTPDIEIGLNNLTASGCRYLVGWVLQSARQNREVALCLRDFHAACSEPASQMADAFTHEESTTA